MKTEIKLDIRAQPDDETCGPTCLYSLYRHYGVRGVTLKKVISQIHRLDSGGTLAEILACHALKRGFKATIYTFHLQMFDPTWFASDGRAHDPADLAARLDQQAMVKRGDKRLKVSTRAFKEFLSLGGELKMVDLNAALIRGYLAKGTPIIAGLSSTFLYRTSREIGEENVDDDVRGEPQGHFVMLVGYDHESKEVLVADPLDTNPPFHTAKYRLPISRILNAILLGILTYDANLLVLEPGPEMAPKRRSRKKKAKKKPAADAKAKPAGVHASKPKDTSLARRRTRSL